MPNYPVSPFSVLVQLKKIHMQLKMLTFDNMRTACRAFFSVKELHENAIELKSRLGLAKEVCDIALSIWLFLSWSNVFNLFCSEKNSIMKCCMPSSFYNAVGKILNLYFIIDGTHDNCCCTLVKQFLAQCSSLCMLLRVSCRYSLTLYHNYILQKLNRYEDGMVLIWAAMAYCVYFCICLWLITWQSLMDDLCIKKLMEALSQLSCLLSFHAFTAMYNKASQTFGVLSSILWPNFTDGMPIFPLFHIEL